MEMLEQKDFVESFKEFGLKLVYIDVLMRT